MAFKPDFFHLTMALMIIFLALLAYRLLRIFLRRSKTKPPEPRPTNQLLMNALAEQTRGQRQAEEERKLSQQALEELRQLHATMIAQMPVALVVICSTGNVRFANPLATQYFNSEPGQNLFEVLNDSLKQQITQAMDRKSNEPFQMTWQTGGKVIQGLMSVTPLPQTCWMLTVQDQTKIVQLEEQVRLKRDLAMMGEVASGIAHEVKNALAIIQGHVQMLPYGEVESHSEEIQSEINRLLACVREFMQSSKNESLVLTDVSLAELFETLHTHWLQHPQGNRVQIRQPTTKVVVKGDANLLLVLFNNLILNGLEASEGHSTDAKWVTLTAETSGDTLQISVADQGPGFSENAMAKRFVPFVSTKKHGSGFGLFHCRRIMMQHAGSIDIHNHPPTTLTCTFPLNRDAD